MSDIFKYNNYFECVCAHATTTLIYIFFIISLNITNEFSPNDIKFNIYFKFFLFFIAIALLVYLIYLIYKFNTLHDGYILANRFFLHSIGLINIMCIAYIIINTGGLFNSKFTWYLELAVITTTQLTVFSKDNNRWRMPVSFALSVLVLYIVIYLWPLNQSSSWVWGDLGNWVEYIQTLAFIIIVQLIVESATQDKGSIRKSLKEFLSK